MEDVLPNENIGALAAALAKAQAAMKPASQDRENTHLKSKYATLTSVWDACREALAANGLAVVQMPMMAEDGWIGLETRLIHSSGQSVTSVFKAPIPENRGTSTLQAYGSALTYMRRYSLASIVGVVADEDTDGHGDPAPPRQQQTRRQEPQQQAAPPESRGDAAANGAANELETARKAFAAAFDARWPDVGSNKDLRFAVLTQLVKMAVTTVADWDVRKFNAAASRIGKLSDDAALDLLERAQDALQKPSPTSALPLDDSPFDASTDATPRFTGVAQS